MPRTAQHAVGLTNAQRVGDLLRATAEAGTRTPEAAALFLDGMDAEVVFDPTRVWPDATVYRGRDGVRQFFDRWLRGWEEYRHDVIEVLEAGSYVVVVLHEHGRARASGIEVDHVFAQLWQLHDGKVTSWRAYRTKQEALEAAGVRR
ncbi:MAG: nuclear transport factor 2 family protein [Thermoleophilaceae bacterium]